MVHISDRLLTIIDSRVLTTSEIYHYIWLALSPQQNTAKTNWGSKYVPSITLVQSIAVFLFEQERNC